VYVSFNLCVLQSAHIQLKAHVLSTPVIDDFNMDGVVEELVVAVNYYLDSDSEDDDYDGR